MKETNIFSQKSQKLMVHGDDKSGRWPPTLEVSLLNNNCTNYHSSSKLFSYVVLPPFSLTTQGFQHYFTSFKIKLYPATQFLKNRERTQFNTPRLGQLSLSLIFQLSKGIKPEQRCLNNINIFSLLSWHKTNAHEQFMCNYHVTTFLLSFMPRRSDKNIWAWSRQRS